MSVVKTTSRVSWCETLVYRYQAGERTFVSSRQASESSIAYQYLHPHGECFQTYLERAQQALVHAHHGSRIIEFSAVVGCTEECYELALREELVAIFYDLMCATDEIHVMLLQKARYNIWSKREAHTSVVLAPSGNVLVWVGPKQIAKKTAVGNLHCVSLCAQSVTQAKTPVRS